MLLGLRSAPVLVLALLHRLLLLLVLVGQSALPSGSLALAVLLSVCRRGRNSDLLRTGALGALLLKGIGLALNLAELWNRHRPGAYGEALIIVGRYNVPAILS
jgi:hypothetical protein